MSKYLITNRVIDGRLVWFARETTFFGLWPYYSPISSGDTKEECIENLKKEIIKQESKKEDFREIIEF